MNFAESQALGHGLYVLHWKDTSGGGTSQAAVGSNRQGHRWYACTNHVATSVCFDWSVVERAERVEVEGPEEREPQADKPLTPGERFLLETWTGAMATTAEKFATSRIDQHKAADLTLRLFAQCDRMEAERNAARIERDKAQERERTAQGHIRAQAEDLAVLRRLADEKGWPVPVRESSDVQRCSACASELLFVARSRDTRPDLCGPCFRKETGTQTPAEKLAAFVRRISDRPVFLSRYQVECCRRIGRDEVSRSSEIGLAELDALCDTALRGASDAHRDMDARKRDTVANGGDPECTDCVWLERACAEHAIEVDQVPEEGPRDGEA